MKFKLFLSLGVLFFLGCKKINSDYQNYFGDWYTNYQSSNCGKYVIINLNSKSEYGNTGYYEGCNPGKSFKGKTRVSGNKLYIGNWAFDIVNEPYLTDTVFHYYGGFSVWEMKLRTPKLYGNRTLTLRKIEGV